MPTTEQPLMQQDDALSVHGGAAPILVQIDKGLGKQFLLIIWFSAFASALATVGLLLVALFMMDALDFANKMRTYHDPR